jgi:hypothetical protein
MKHTLVFTLIVIAFVTGINRVGRGMIRPVDSTTASLDRVIEIERSDATLLLALSLLGVEHRVPIGFEEAMDSDDRINRHIHLRTGTLKSILDSLVAQEPTYKWELRDGVINITPVVGRDPLLAQFLERHVARFAPSASITDKFELRDRVLNLPEVRQFLKTNSIAVRGYDYSYSQSIYSTNTVDVVISDTDVRGVLNHIAKQTEHKMWSLKRVGDKRELLLTY